MTLPYPPAPATGFEFLALRGWSRRDTVFSTVSLGPLVTTGSAVDLAPGWRLYEIQMNRPARLRMYASEAQRLADAGRPVGSDPESDVDHGLLFEFVSSDLLLAAVLSPQVDGYCPSGIAVPWAITNLDVGAGVVTVTLTWVRTE